VNVVPVSQFLLFVCSDFFSVSVGYKKILSLDKFSIIHSQFHYMQISFLFYYPNCGNYFITFRSAIFVFQVMLLCLLEMQVHLVCLLCRILAEQSLWSFQPFWMLEKCTRFCIHPSNFSVFTHVWHSSERHMN